jgi:hypothetical protein
MLEKVLRQPTNKPPERSSGYTMSAKPVLLAWLLLATSALASDPALPDPTLTGRLTEWIPVAGCLSKNQGNPPFPPAGQKREALERARAEHRKNLWERERHR